MSERQRIDLLRSRDPNMVVNLQLLWIMDCELWIVFVNCDGMEQFDVLSFLAKCRTMPCQLGNQMTEL